MCHPVVDPLILRENERRNRKHPKVQERERPPLAIVGGGPSLVTALEELRRWPGDIWACGSPYQWLRERGIDSTFFNIDPLEETIDLARGAKHAILSTTNHPGVFGVVESVETFDLGDYVVLVTSAATAPHVAVHMGYTDVSFFGCDSSFLRQTHVYKNEEWEAVIFVKCGEGLYPTKPQLLIQGQAISELIRLAPHVFKDRSAGLLTALVENDNHDVTHWNLAMQRLAGVAPPLRLTHPDLPDLLIVSPQEHYEALKRGYA